MSGYTPGEWRSYMWGDRIKIEAVERTPSLPIVRPVCILEGFYKEADARLIAAAPDLLEALIDARKQLEDYERSLNGEGYNSPSINAAIAKAITAEQAGVEK